MVGTRALLSHLRLQEQLEAIYGAVLAEKGQGARPLGIPNTSGRPQSAHQQTRRPASAVSRSQSGLRGSHKSPTRPARLQSAGPRPISLERAPDQPGGYLFSCPGPSPLTGETGRLHAPRGAQPKWQPGEGSPGKPQRTSCRPSSAPQHRPASPHAVRQVQEVVSTPEFNTLPKPAQASQLMTPTATEVHSLQGTGVEYLESWEASRDDFRSPLGSPVVQSPAGKQTLRPNAKRKAGAAAARARNPFIEYEDREKRLAQERQWLQEDSVYLDERKEDLRHGAKMRQLATRCSTDEELYENRMFWGPYSVRMRATKGKSLGRECSPPPVQGKRPQSGGGGRALPEDGVCAQIRKLQQEMKTVVNRRRVREKAKQLNREISEHWNSVEEFEEHERARDSVAFLKGFQLKGSLPLFN